MAMPLEDIMAQTGLVSFPENAIVAQQVIGTGDGIELSFILSGDAMADLANDALAAMGDPAGLEMLIGDVFVTCVLDANGDLISMEMLMDVSMEIEGLVVEISTLVRTEVVQLGGVTITFPAVLGAEAPAAAAVDYNGYNDYNGNGNNEE